MGGRCQSRLADELQLTIQRSGAMSILWTIVIGFYRRGASETHHSWF